MKYVILGASAAGINAAKTLRRLDNNAAITVVSEDQQVYSRCMLHHLISGERTLEKLNFTTADFFEKNDIQWLKNLKAVDLDTKTKTVLLSNQEKISYDKLLIATGASSFIPPVPGLREANNVYGLRNMEDAVDISKKCSSIKNVAVIGAGLVGIDAVVGLLERDMNISLIEMAPRILSLQLDDYTAGKYQEAFAAKGVDIYTNVKAQRVDMDAEHTPTAVVLDDGTSVPADLIIVATGVKPNISFIRENTINLDRGILVNKYFETSEKDVYAAGDVLNRNPIWPMAVKQAIAAAHNMAGQAMIMDDDFGLRNSMNFLGLPTVSIGAVTANDDTFLQHVEFSNNSYKKVIYKDGLIYGALFQGDISYSGVFMHLIKNKINISHLQKDIFDIDYADFFSIKEDGQFAFAQ